MRRRLLPLLLIGSLASAFIAVDSAMADSVRSAAITSVDSRTKEDTKVHVLVDDPVNSPGYKFTMIENDKSLPISKQSKITDELLANGVQRRTVFVVDTNAQLVHDGRFDAEKAAVKLAIEGLTGGPNDLATVVGAGNDYIRTGDFTSDKTLLETRVDGLNTLVTGRSMNAAVGFALDQLHDAKAVYTNSDDADAQISNLVIFSSGGATDTTVNVGSLRNKVDADNVNVFVGEVKVTVKDSHGGILLDTDASSLNNLVVNKQGIFRTSNSDATTPKLGADLGNAMNNQWLLEYKSAAKTVMQIETRVVGKSAFAITNVGVASYGSGLHADFSKPGLSSNIPHIAPWILQVFIAFCVLVFMFIIVFIVSQLVDRKGSLEFALAPYQDTKIDADEDKDLHVETAIMRRALAVTETIARDRGIFVTVEEKLYQADLPINAAEYIFVAAAATVLLAALGFSAKGLLGGVIAIVIGCLAAPTYLNFKASQRKRKFEKQLPDTLHLLAGSLRAGLSLLQGLNATVQQVDDPLAKELRQALGEAQLGRSVEDALQEMADRVQSIDFKWTVLAIRIQRDVGGNLAEVLDNVARTMIERERLRREVKSLTAEGRLSAIVLGAMPPILALYLWVANPSYLNVLFTDNFGKWILFSAVGLMVLGGLWMKSMLRFDF